MTYSLRNLLRLTTAALVLFLFAVFINETSSAVTKNNGSQMTKSDGVVASVGDEKINFSLLNTMLNSSAMVGLSVPALGTAERNYVIVTLLDKVITANLLYLDAKKQGVNQNETYRNDVTKFKTAILSSLYKSKYLLSDVSVSDKEIDAYHNSSENRETELTEDNRSAIESKLRKIKVKEIEAHISEKIREDVKVNIDEDVLDSGNDDGRSDEDIIAHIESPTGTIKITWSEVKSLMIAAEKRADSAAFYMDVDDERLKRLNEIIDTQILANKARVAGLENDPSYINRLTEFSKTRLINLHRNGLIHTWSISNENLEDYFKNHMDKIAVPEMRKVQMVVVKTEKEANEIKQKIDAGELTIYQAAMNYSIVPDAKKNLGEFGWLSKGSGFPELDNFVFNQDPDVLTGPVESPAGWHLVKVLDVQDAQFENFANDQQARRKALRMYMQEKLNEYVVELRTKHFDVTVDSEELGRQFKNEAEFIVALNKKAGEQGSVTKTREQDLKKWMR